MEGYAEVLPTRVIVLDGISERANEIDVEKSRAEMQQAQQQLSKAGSPDVDWQRANVMLERAIVRLQVASKEGS
jgi:F0F1-type ATP synthase epsilon subunit